MLVLTKKKGDDITINDNIIIKVLDVKSGKVKLGIEAPASVKICKEKQININKDDKTS